MFVPVEDARERARLLLADLLPEADQVTAETHDETVFVDQGENFLRVLCPVCGTELPTGWWTTSMERACESRFVDLDVITPCCGRRSTLNDLNYDWPAGFARFILEACNPGIVSRGLDLDDLRRLEEIVGCNLRTVRGHY
jgi:hypothetical protein